MEDLRNKELYKLMWLPVKSEILWRMKDETLALPHARQLILSCINQYFDINDWYENYSKSYHDWLNNDNPTIFDLKNKLNWEVVLSLKRVNKLLARQDILLFYWFDIDRSKYDNWKWSKDPITNKPLSELDLSFHELNKKVSEDNYIVFPANV